MRSTIPERPSYHSAHAPDVAAPPRARVELGGSVALVHDVSSGVLPADYAACDVLYADLPWPNGMAAFNDRAAADGTIDHQGVRKLPPPDVSAPIRLNQWAAVVAAYHTTDMPQRCGTDIEVIGHLARRYARVGDFCCGYGRTLRLFARHGKRFTGSDYNARCIGYIAEHAPEWAPDAD
jgi:SAM-dependent methyltransferase